MPVFKFLSPSAQWSKFLGDFSPKPDGVGLKDGGYFRRLDFKGLTHAFFFLLIVLTAFAPPGLCACWLIPQVATVHPHTSKAHAESPHSHDYLLQFSQTTSPEILPLIILPARVLIALAFAGLIWWALRGDEVSEAGWVPVIPIEPPESACKHPRRFVTSFYAYNRYFSSLNGVLHGSLKLS